MTNCALPRLDRDRAGTLLSLLLIMALTASGLCREELSFSDVDGKQFSLKAPADHRALVLIFVTTDCPIANSYQPKLAKLYTEFWKQGFEFLLIHEGPSQSPEKLKKHSQEYSVPFSVVMDPDHSIARRVGARMTPEAFVLSRDGVILYQGRIDDLHPRFGKKRSSVSREDLRLALLEVVSGNSVSVPKTDAVGCSIPR
jgi:peroxiredoxin